METNDNIIDVSYVDTYVFKKEDYKFIKEFTYRETIDHIYLKSYIFKNFVYNILDSPKGL